MSPDTLVEEVRLLRETAGAARIERDVVRAEGEAAVDYLQGQISQDVGAMAVGESAGSFVLQPQGKVDAWFRITRVADDAFVMDVDAGHGEALVARLERFRLRTAVTFTPLDWEMVAVRGAAATAPEAGRDELVVAVDHPGDRGWDVLGPAPVVPDGATEVSPEALEVLRIEAGVPRMGVEIDESTIPAETGVVAASVSFTKGCYTGQELVARIDSRGSRTPRRLVGLRLAGEVPAVGAPLRVGDDEVGRVTSVAPVGAHGGPVALGYLARQVDTPSTVRVGDGETSGEALELPLVTAS